MNNANPATKTFTSYRAAKLAVAKAERSHRAAITRQCALDYHERRELWAEIARGIESSFDHLVAVLENAKRQGHIVPCCYTSATRALIAGNID